MTVASYSMHRPGVTSRPFGEIGGGKSATIYRLCNALGTQVEISDLGGIIVSLWIADRHGHFDDIVLGLDTPLGYLDNPARLGALVGRYAGRIAGARFPLCGASYQLVANNGKNHLHGGPEGFDRRLWTAEPFQRPNGTGLRLTLKSPDGEEGFPGALDISVTYTLDDENRLTVDYHAVSDQPTILNLTQHSYFNLGGHQNNDISSHCLWIGAGNYLPLDDNMIPTGDICDVADTPMDFRRFKAIGQDLNAPDRQITIAGGYDHCWVLARARRPEPLLAAQVYHPLSGRRLMLWTDQPGLQFYTGNALDGSIVGKSGTPYQTRQGFCFETQNFPDAPNQPHFPSPVIRPGEEYSSRTIFKFDIHQQESLSNDPRP